MSIVTAAKNANVQIAQQSLQVDIAHGHIMLVQRITAESMTHILDLTMWDPDLQSSYSLGCIHECPAERLMQSKLLVAVSAVSDCLAPGPLGTLPQAC